jgi:hypothetical protein
MTRLDDIPDAAVEAADAELETSAIYLSDKTIRRILTAALPHLVAERDAEIARLRAALSDMLSGWRYIRTHHGDLSGVGWGRCEDAASAALEPPGDG